LPAVYRVSSPLNRTLYETYEHAYSRKAEATSLQGRRGKRLCDRNARQRRHPWGWEGEANNQANCARAGLPGRDGRAGRPRSCLPSPGLGPTLRGSPRLHSVRFPSRVTLRAGWQPRLSSASDARSARASRCILIGQWARSAVLRTVTLEQDEQRRPPKM